MSASIEIRVLTEALKALSNNFDLFISDCVDEEGNPKTPTKKAIYQARACLPAYCKNSFVKVQA